MRNFFQNKRVFLTGASGFIGSQLVRRLVENKCSVTALIRPSSNLWRIEDIKSKIEIIKGDLTGSGIFALKKKLSGTEIIYHLGAYGVAQHEKDTKMLFETNVAGTYNILKLARDIKVKRFIYCGSCSEYGEGNVLNEKDFPAPVSEYGLSKLSGSALVYMFCKAYELPTITLRPFMIYGPFEGTNRLIPHTVLSVFNKQDIPLTGGEQTRDFVFINDAVDAFLKAAEVTGIEGETFNIATGKAVSIKKVVLLILDLMSAQTKPLFGALAYRVQESWSLSGNPLHARNKLKWEAKYSLKEGLKETIQWFKENRTHYDTLRST